ncbi:MAG: type II toxin-antitoxin system HicB family antitoxin [Gammaproteobacteria bacterium]|nr:type II toxin-antitoxin system HicB family antitoxin [Gammaproteobacteria bacterium]
MSTLSLRLPDSLHEQIKKLASEDGVSINQFVVSAVAEKTSAFLTRSYLEERGKLSSKTKFKKALSKVPKITPDDFDKL